MRELVRRFRWLFFLGLAVALLTLALWPVVAEGDSGDPAQARACSRTLGRLASTVHRGETAQGILTEAEINAHLARILAHNPEARASHGLRIGLRDLRVDLEPGEARLFLVAELVGVPLTLESRFAETATAQAPLRLDALRIGRLPLVEPLKTLTAGRLRKLLEHLHEERSVLEHLSSVAVTSNQALVVVGPHPEPG